MTDGVPLKQVITPGEYRIIWTVPTQTGGSIQLEGDLDLRPDRQPEGNIYGEGLAEQQVEGSAFRMNLPQTYEPGLIKGQLLNGQYVVLVDAAVHVWMHDRAVIYGRAALIGRSPLSSDEVNILKMKVQIEGLDAITGVPPIKELSFPRGKSEGKRFLESSWQVNGNPDSTQEWSDDSVELAFRFDCSWTAPEGFFFRLSFSPIVSVEYKHPVQFSTALSEWVEPLRSIVSLSTGRRERTTFLSVSLADGQADDEDRIFQVYGTALQQSPFASRGNDILKMERAFLVSPTHMSLLELTRQWQKLAEEHHPLLETYASLMFAPVQHPRSRFLLLLQAIEGLHGFETRSEWESRLGKHGEERGRAIEEAEAQLSSKALRFIRKYLMKRPPATLDAAISKIFDELPVDMRPLLSQTEFIAGMLRDERGPRSIEECLRIARNDLAHGTRGYDAQQLLSVVEVLDRVVNSHLLRILGCSPEAQRRVLERRR